MKMGMKLSQMIPSLSFLTTKLLSKPVLQSSTKRIMFRETRTIKAM